MANQAEIQELLDRLTHLNSPVQVLCDKADDLRQRGRFDDAGRLCDEALRLATQIGEPLPEGICRLHQWGVNYSRRAYAQAIADCERGRQAFENASEDCDGLTAQFALGMTYVAQGGFYRIRGAPDKSSTAFRNALETYTKAQSLAAELKQHASRNRSLTLQCQAWITELDEKFDRTADFLTRSAAEAARIDPPGSPVSLRNLKLIPVIEGPIAGGPPVPSIDDVVGYLEVIGEQGCIGDAEYTIRPIRAGAGSEIRLDPREFLYFITSVEGSSMDRAGIANGDYVLLQRSRNVPILPDDGEIVAAIIDGTDRKATLKRFSQRAGKVALVPDSTDRHQSTFEFTPIEWDDTVRVAGVALAVLKRI